MSIKEYNKAILNDKEEVNNLEIEVNFSDDKKLKRYVKMTIGEQSAVIAIKDLHNFVMAVANINQLADLLPFKTIYTKKLIRSHVVELNQDVKQGETVTIRCETDVPLSIYEKLEQEQREKLAEAN